MKTKPSENGECTVTFTVYAPEHAALVRVMSYLGIERRTQAFQYAIRLLARACDAGEVSDIVHALARYETANKLDPKRYTKP